MMSNEDEDLNADVSDILAELKAEEEERKIAAEAVAESSKKGGSEKKKKKKKKAAKANANSAKNDNTEL